MLDPDFLDRAPGPLVNLARRLEDFVIGEVARRLTLAEGKIISPTALWEAMAAESVGALMDSIQDEAAKIAGLAQAQVNEVFETALRASIRYGSNIVQEAGGTPYAPYEIEGFQALADALKSHTNGLFKNLTNTTGFAETIGGKVRYKPIAQFYQQVSDEAYFEAASGAVSYRQAIERAINKMAASGLRVVEYESGWHNRIDVAVRRNVMTGLNQVSNHIADNTASRLGTEIMEISAHSGARPTHQVWQGQLVDKSGANPRYLTLSDIGFGQVDGFSGANCRHNWHPFVEGVSRRSYTDEELRRIDPPPITYQGKTYTAYQARQQQRKIETAMRASKRKLIGLSAAGQDQAFGDTSVKLRQQRRLYREFSAAAGLPMQPDRAKQPGFEGALSKKSTAAAAKALKRSTDGKRKVSTDDKRK